MAKKIRMQSVDIEVVKTAAAIMGPFSASQKALTEKAQRDASGRPSVIVRAPGGLIVVDESALNPEVSK